MVNDYKDFINISIRGRVAFSVTCLERALELYGIKEPLLNDMVISKIWEFTSSTSLDNWLDEVLLLDPLVCDELSVEEVQGLQGKLKLLYSSLPVKIKALISSVISVGTTNIYSGTESYSPRTLDAVLHVLFICKQLGVDPPSILPFRTSDIKENDGWGLHRDKSYFTRS